MERLGHAPSASHDTAEHLRSLGVEPPASTLGGTLYFIENCLHIEFDADNRVTFIGLSPREDIELHYKGQEILTRPADEVVQILARGETGTPPVFDENEMLFSEQIVTLWEADPQYDPFGERYPVWGQIGIGSVAYRDE